MAQTNIMMVQQAFQPHQFPPNQMFIDLYHVYDNLSQTPYVLGQGIQCGDREVYYMNAWHVITPRRLLEHQKWANRNPTQFISFVDRANVARAERNRRRAQVLPPGGGVRIPASVRIAHIRLLRGTNVWSFNRAETVAMMQAVNGPAHQVFVTMGSSEWLVFGDVPNICVVTGNMP
ncbi:hypothetical protein LTR17_001744 [Elasticomyces elasticus]|nr:hypothetical protein LTR17_001744 [Elasticomyces elasticus]